MVKLHSAVFYFVSLKIGEFANLLQAFSARFQDMKSEESSKGEHTFSISINCVFPEDFPVLRRPGAEVCISVWDNLQLCAVLDKTDSRQTRED